MPVFSFFCDNRHETEWFGSRERRPSDTSCKTCGELAKLGFSASLHQGIAPSAHMNATYSKEFHGLSLHDFKCDSCKHEFDDIVDHGDGKKPSDGVVCEKCGAHASWIPAAHAEHFWSRGENFPYFDRGLGKWIKSKQHRLEICKNPRNYGINSDGLTPVDGDWDVDREASKRNLEERKLIDGYNDYSDRLENAPEFKGFRVARDQGRI